MTARGVLNITILEDRGVISSEVTYNPGISPADLPLILEFARRAAEGAAEEYPLDDAGRRRFDKAMTDMDAIKAAGEALL